MLRIARESDVPAILAIYAPYILTSTATFEYTVPTQAQFLERFRRITAQFPWLVWEEDGELQGYAYASAPYERAAFGWCAEPSVYLRPGVRGRGIGKKLYDALEKILTRQGYQVFYALITAENAASLRFHEKQGYVRSVCFDSCGFKFGRWLGLIWMEKRPKPVEIPSCTPTPWRELVQDSQTFSDILDNLSLS